MHAPPKPSKRIPNGWSISRALRQDLKLSFLLVDLKIEDWSNLNVLAKTSLENDSNAVHCTASVVLDHWCRVFSKVHSKLWNKSEVRTMARKVQDYLNDESIKAGFKTKFDDYKLELILKSESSRNKKRVRRNAITEVGSDLDYEYTSQQADNKEDNLNDNNAIDINTITDDIGESSKYGDGIDESSKDDDNTVNNKLINIKRRLFEEAENLHDEIYKRSAPITHFERKRMGLGLSGILDIADDHQQSQRKLFDYNTWKILKKYFTKHYTLQVIDLDNYIQAAWKYIYTVATKDNNITVARQFLHNLCSLQETDPKKIRTYTLLQTVLDSMEDSSYLLKPTTRVTERDYSYQIWLPLLKKLFGINKLIRLKTGESAISTLEKKELYEESSHVIGFKIDIRCIFDFGDMEFDIATFESCSPASNEDKVVTDEGKLLREGVSNLVNLQFALDDDQDIYCFTIQLSGLNASFVTPSYNGSDLFIVVPQFSVDYPTCLEELGSFSVDLPKLFSFAHYVEQTAHALNLLLLKKEQSASPYNNVFKDKSDDTATQEQSKISSLKNWMTPPRNKRIQSRIPHINTELLKKASDTEVSDTEDESPKSDMNEGIGQEDRWGIRKEANGYYCTVTGEFCVEHPFEKKK